MRLRELARRRRNDLLWFLAGLLAMQAGLGAALEFGWTAVRDPEYAALERIVRRRQAECPGRPLVLALGSSRTALGLKAGCLNDRADPAAPLVVNCAVFASGPLMQQVVLRRLLGAGLRPRLVFLEATPLFLGERAGGDPFEVTMLDPRRLTAAELTAVCGYCRGRAWRAFTAAWAQARALPATRYRRELRDALALGRPAGPGRAWDKADRDGYGWSAPPATFTPAQIEKRTADALMEYRPALTGPGLSAGACRAWRDTLELCRQEGVEAVLVAPPVGRAFRNCCPAVERRQWAELCELAAHAGAPVIDARTWVDEGGFFDGHHALEGGTRQYTERFQRDILAPRVAAWRRTPGAPGAPLARRDR